MQDVGDEGKEGIRNGTKFSLGNWLSVDTINRENSQEEAEFLFKQVEFAEPAEYSHEVVQKRALDSRMYFVLSMWLLTETLSVDEAV